jgi:hypothetical protein
LEEKMNITENIDTFYDKAAEFERRRSTAPDATLAIRDLIEVVDRLRKRVTELEEQISAR